ncbi:hypothetical protein E8A73_005430 [Polyangium aurulentum]|nr:hypothetical protein E8A73_005430 [Polyangium aurulentum]
MRPSTDELTCALLALRPDLFRWMRKWHHPSDDQEDAAQEISDRGVRRLSTFTHGGLDELKGWLYVLALRESLPRRKHRAQYVHTYARSVCRRDRACRTRVVARGAV